MVVLSAAICTKNGKALLSRQFVEMGRLRIEGLLAAFTKLVVGETGKQHTFVETDNVRYVYLPVETLYLLLITNKGSNIIEDLDTLRLLSQVIPEQLGLGIPVNEDSVANKAFELLFAFDEVIASGGYREDINLHTIVTNLQMESHEEKLAQMIKASKMAEAKEAAKRKAQELREKAKEEERTGVRSGNKYGTVSSDDYRMSRAFSSADPYNTSSSSSRSNARDDGPTSSSADSGSGAAATSKAASKSGTGMKLGAKKAAGGMSGAMAGVIAEEGLRAKDLMVDDMGSSGAGSSAQAAINAAKAAAEAASADQVVVTIEEKVTVGITRDGACEQMEVKGSLSLQVQDESASKVQVVLTRGDDRQFQYSNNPNINKARFAAEAVLALKQADKPFPVGQPLGVLRWSYRNKDDDGGQVPLMITCWPEESGRGEMTVSVEYTLQRTEITLREVLISIPLSSDATPEVASCDGVYKHNTRENTLVWRIDTVSGDNATGQMEFKVKGRDADAFFPVQVSFNSSDTLCPLQVSTVIPAEADPATARPYRYTAKGSMVTEGYTVNGQ